MANSISSHSPDGDPTDSHQIVLASSSRYRRELLARLGLPFVCASPDIDETPNSGESPATLVRRLAQAKAQALAATYPAHLVFGSDQVACCNGQILGKPGNISKAHQQLAMLSNQRVEFLTGIALLNTKTSRLQVDLDITEVSFRDLSAEEIEAYVQREQPLDCAGSFKSEGLGVTLFHRIDNSDPTALIGLPLIKVCDMLRQENFDPLIR